MGYDKSKLLSSELYMVEEVEKNYDELVKQANNKEWTSAVFSSMNILVMGLACMRRREESLAWLEKILNRTDGVHKPELGISDRDTQANASGFIATMYYQGSHGFPVDYNKAMELYKISADLGNEQSAEYYRQGIPKKKNAIEKAYGCYIATCVYGSYNCPEVWVLRRYRDNTLSNSWLGRKFIKVYYAVSPKIVSMFGKRKWFNKFFKSIINKIVVKLRKNGVEDKPYTDRRV